MPLSFAAAEVLGDGAGRGFCLLKEFNFCEQFCPNRLLEEVRLDWDRAGTGGYGGRGMTLFTEPAGKCGGAIWDLAQSVYVSEG